jgi:hypothetical protein
VDVPGYSKPAHQYGTGSCAAQRELDETEAAELSLWERDGFTVRTEESTT